MSPAPVYYVLKWKVELTCLCQLAALMLLKSSVESCLCVWTVITDGVCCQRQMLNNSYSTSPCLVFLKVLFKEKMDLCQAGVRVSQLTSIYQHVKLSGVDSDQQSSRCSSTLCHLVGFVALKCLVSGHANMPHIVLRNDP